MNISVGRRAVLGGVLGGALAAAAAPGAQAASRSPHPGPGWANSPSSLSRADRVFLQRGLMHGAWVRSGPSDGWYPDAKLWNGSGFTTPQFYREHLAKSASKVLEYSEDVMRGLHKPTWALARAPYGEHVNPPLPDPTAEWMTPSMQKNVDNLFSVCFGDEENYSLDRVDYFRQAYARMHEKYPWVLVHNNQTLSQYNTAQLSDYVTTAKPDLLTWDWYPWQRNPSYAGGSVTGIYRQIELYRRAAMAGLDGTGAQPIAFGQYTTGFRLQPERPADDVNNVNRFKRRLYVSESQLNLAPYLTWAAGGKWLSLFRWELNEDYLDPVSGNTWETDGLVLTDGSGSPLPSYYRYAKVNADMARLSPYLTRLRTRAIGRVAGLDSTGRVLPNIAGIPTWAPDVDADSGLVGVSATNIGTVNGLNRGDVFIGTFAELPDMTAGENQGILPDRAAASAFMLVNGLTNGNSNYADPLSTGGSGAQCRQLVEVKLDPAKVAAGRDLSLYRLDRQTGQPVTVPLVHQDGMLAFTAELDGGAGELFIWG